MTFTPQEIEELKRDGWEWVEDREMFQRHEFEFGLLFELHHNDMDPDGPFILFSRDRQDSIPCVDRFSTLQELREFFGLGVEG